MLCLLVDVSVHGLGVVSSGVKEIDIAATLEHVRDQRPGMVRTKVSRWVNKQPPSPKFSKCFPAFLVKGQSFFALWGITPLFHRPWARGEQPHPP